MRFGIVIGTRPEVMKNYSIVRSLRAAGEEVFVLHTGQHYDDNLNAAIFEQAGYHPDFMMEGEYRVGRAIDWVSDKINELNLDLVIVNGDTAASLVGATAAIYTDIKLAHVEAGLRSNDVEMVEERNRIMVDAAAHYLFAYTADHAEFLGRVPDLRGQVHLVGNATIDFIENFQSSFVPPAEEDFAYVTLHR